MARPRIAQGGWAAAMGSNPGVDDLRRLSAEYERLLELDRAKDRFLADMSHELRTPLTSIISCTELLAAGGTAPLEPYQAELVAVIDRGAARLLRLINQLVLMSRLESGQVTVQPRPVDLAAAVAAVLADQDAPLRAAGLDLDVRIDPGPPVRADPDRLADAVTAVLTDLREGVTRGGLVAVRAEPAPTHWLLELAGGTPDGSSGAASRANLNLRLGRLIVELHGGTMTVDSTGRERRVTIALPLAEPAS